VEFHRPDVPIDEGGEGDPLPSGEDDEDEDDEDEDDEDEDDEEGRA
jgi:hypothetical protein